MSPPDRAAVERQVADLIMRLNAMPSALYVACYASETDAILRNLLQRLELAEQEKAEAVAQVEDFKHAQGSCDCRMVTLESGIVDQVWCASASRRLAAYDAKER